MAIRRPLVVVGSQVQQVPATDTIDDPKIGTYAPGSFTILTGQYGLMVKRLTLTTTQRVTIAGDGRLAVTS